MTMKCEKTNAGFLLSSDRVHFDFTSSVQPETENSMLCMDILGEVPVPKLEGGDRILIPMGEGIALTVGEESPIENAFGHYEYCVPDPKAPKEPSE